ncbi:MAG: histidine kinase dimerization/phospho-acceptor domain-containing protein [Limnobacter sp.]|nr:histidine kinase dimerization/phospho-acceptor domain-containing protein [Limnobacter sp.]
MQSTNVNEAINSWLDLMGLLEMASVGYGFLAALLAMTVAVEMRTSLSESFSRSKYLLWRFTILLCYQSSIFFCASFGSLALPKYMTDSYSVTAIVLSYLILLPTIGIIVALVNQIKSLWQYRFGYALGTTITFFITPIAFMLLPQFGNLYEVNWGPILIAFPLAYCMMFGLSAFAYRASRQIQMPVLTRMIHILLVTSVMQFMVFVTISMAEFTERPKELAWYWLPISHSTYEWMITVVCFTLITLLLMKVYAAVCERVLGLESEAEMLAEENIQKEKVVANQRDLLFKTNARVKELEFSLQQEHNSGGISADSLIAAVLNLEDGIFEWDLEKQTLKLGPYWCDLLGIPDYMEPELRLNTLLKGVLPEDWSSARLKISNLLTAGSMQEHAQLRYVNPLGVVMKVDVRIVAVRNPYGLPNRLVGILTDRTKDMDVEYAIRKELSEESTLSKLKSDFVSYLSHEIRTPMTIISSANALMDSDIRMNRLDMDRAQDYTEQVSNALMSLRSLVDETLDFMSSGNTQSHDLETTWVDISTVVRNIIELESKRRHLSLEQAVQVTLVGDVPALIEVAEIPLTQAIRQFVVYVMQELTGATLRVRCEGAHKVSLSVCLPAQPDWLVGGDLKLLDSEGCKEALVLPIQDEALPFGLLLTKRVIRNIKGGLNILVHKHEQELKFCLILEFPFARETECQS